MKRFLFLCAGQVLLLTCAASILSAAAPATDYYRNVEAIYQRASRLVLERRYEEAISLFTEINNINPYIAEIHGNLGYLYESVGNPELAVSEYRNALEIDPGYGDALNNLGYLLARRVETRAEAVELCRRAVFQDPDNPSYRDSYGYVLLVAGDVSEAFVQFERALFYNKETASPYYHLGLIYYQKGELEKARQQFSRAVSFRDCPAMAYLRLSQTLVEMGNLSGAIETMKKARWTAEKGWLSPASRMELETHLECFLRMGLLQGMVEVEQAGTGREGEDLSRLPLDELPPDTRVFIEREALENYFLNASGLVMCRQHGYNPMAAVLRDRVRARRGPYLERKGRLLSRIVQLALSRKEIKDGGGVPLAAGAVDLAALERDGYLPPGFGGDYVFIMDATGEISFTVTEGVLASVTIPPGIEIKTIAEATSQLGEREGETTEAAAAIETPFDDYYAEPEEETSVDYTRFIQAPGLVPVSPMLKRGWAVRQRIEAAGQVTENYYAVVGEEDGFWRIEYQGPGLLGMAASFPELKSMLMGLVVNKENGKVMRAVLGQPGEDVTDIKVALMPDIPPTDLPEPVDEKLTIALGTFSSKKYVTPYGTSWSGADGDLEDVLLKSETQGQLFELASMPAWGKTTVDGIELPLSVRKYTNGMEYHIAENEIVAAFYPMGKAGETNQGIYKMVTAVSTQVIIELKKTTKAQLKW